MTNANGVATNPFSPGNSPIELQVAARKIPAWTLDSLYAVGAVQPSPAYSAQPLETITLTPMGGSRLRISAFPTVTTNPAATQWSAPYSPTASYVNGSDTVYAMNDAVYSRQFQRHEHPAHDLVEPLRHAGMGSSGFQRPVPAQSGFGLLV